MFKSKCNSLQKAKELYGQNIAAMQGLETAFKLEVVDKNEAIFTGVIRGKNS